MNMKAQKPIKQPQKQININDTESVKCEDCGNYSFIQSYFIRRISAILSPNGQETMMPIQVYSCGNCGTVPSNMMPKGDE
jgi:predicted nucleic acid-binding Zn ribbon protein|tara:strand:- start:1540 stop:1779 length:240 start_codon:yes stop_codon:yes gene_type:complete